MTLVRRRRQRYKPPRRALVFAPGTIAAFWLWGSWARGTGLVGLGVLLLAVAVIAGPLLLLAVLFALPSAPSLLVPRRWRIRYRRWHGREGARSAYIPQYLRRMVFAADRHRCVMRSVDCQGPLNVDHVRPWSLGGLITLWNLMTLCRYHNQVKSNYWPGHYYRPMPGYANEALAAQILAVERRHRLNVLRWVRAAGALK